MRFTIECWIRIYLKKYAGSEIRLAQVLLIGSLFAEKVSRVWETVDITANVYYLIVGPEWVIMDNKPALMCAMGSMYHVLIFHSDNSLINKIIKDTFSILLSLSLIYTYYRKKVVADHGRDSRGYTIMWMSNLSPWEKLNAVVDKFWGTLI